MHWIRFLKLPKAAVSKDGKYVANALVTITTDLGESFLMSDCDLHVWIEYQENEQFPPSSKTAHKWVGGTRQLAIQHHLDCPEASITRMVIAMAEDFAAASSPVEQSTSLSKIFAARAIVSAQAHPLHELHVERQLTLPGGSILSIYEESGESIARHVWDAGVGFVDLYIHRCSSLPELNRLLSSSNRKGLKVIELGCGCGLAGLAVTAWKENCQVVLTDLPEAENIATLNISKMKVAESSEAKFEVLSWGESIPDHVLEVRYDLVLVTDCTYNPTSASALVATLRALAFASPLLLLVVATKVRHPNEAVFFSLLQGAGFLQLDHAVHPLPSAEGSEYLGEEEGIEIYCFRLGRIKQ